MNAETPTHELTNFFKALADPVRLQVAGQLARQSHSLAELTQALALKPAVLLKHLALLEQMGFARLEAGRYYWRLDVVQALAARVSAAPARMELPEGTPEYERAVLSAFLNADGTLKEIPAQDKKVLVILRYLLERFETGRMYTEKEVNAIIQRLHPDSATLRRWLIDLGWLNREITGRQYWRAG
jgi:hypothetical protein